MLHINIRCKCGSFGRASRQFFLLRVVRFSGLRRLPLKCKTCGLLGSLLLFVSPSGTWARVATGPFAGLRVFGVAPSGALLVPPVGRGLGA